MKKILLAEDDNLIREMIKLNLEMEGYRIQTVDNGASAWEILQRENYDLVLLDVMMPQKDGMAVLKELRNIGKRIPVLMLTSLSETKSKVQGLDLGADDYLTKPFELDELYARVRALLRRKD